MLLGFLNADYEKVASVHFRAGYVPANQSEDQFAQAARAIAEPIFGLPLKEISLARLLSQLFQITQQFEMEAQPQLLLLQKTMLVAEGVGRPLATILDHMGVGMGVVRISYRGNEAVEPVLRQIDPEYQAGGLDPCLDTGQVRITHRLRIAGTGEVLRPDEGLVDELRSGTDKSVPVIGAVIEGAEAGVAGPSEVARIDLIVAPAPGLVIGHRIGTRLPDDGIFKTFVIGTRALVKLDSEHEGRHQLCLLYTSPSPRDRG